MLLPTTTCPLQHYPSWIVCSISYSVGWWNPASGTGTVVYAPNRLLNRQIIYSTLVLRILLQLRYQLRDAGWLDSTHAKILGASAGPGLLVFFFFLKSCGVYCQRQSMRAVWSNPRFVNSWTKRGHGHMVFNHLAPNLLVSFIDDVIDAPEAVKLQILSSIRSFVDKQIE